MATMFFYSKSDCAGSEQQRESLINKGNTVHYTDISAIEWTREKLLPFMRGKEPLEIMDSKSPEIRRGEIDPLLISFDHALTILVGSPHLIKGPLIKVDNLHMQGLQDKRIERYIGNSQKLPQTVTRRKRLKQRPYRQPYLQSRQTRSHRQNVFNEVYA
ncbi:MAG: hypothetical protein QNJ17_09610 [Desulfocapsaceae bacterium]|nr:hypothetical protein [Desulfocapsaceae bacterium]